VRVDNCNVFCLGEHPRRELITTVRAAQVTLPPAYLKEGPFLQG
jgi:hypothetical protein